MMLVVKTVADFEEEDSTEIREVRDETTDKADVGEAKVGEANVDEANVDEADVGEANADEENL